jgi:pimeloyl-ACP methyl ester carboxylesterase
MSEFLKQVRTPQLEIAYEERGDPDALPIVLLHGFPDDVRTWDAVVEGLVAAGYRTLAPYLRGYGPTRFLDSGTARTGQLAALGQDLLDFVDAADVNRFVLVGHDWGARAAYIVASLWPERVRALIALAVGYGTNDPKQTLALAQARAYWYQWYFCTERGRMALAADRRGMCRVLWQLWSPLWEFDEATFQRTAASFDNPDFVDVAIHSYRHRWGEALGDPRYDELEARLAVPIPIQVPTTALMGDEDGATLPETSAGKEHFFTNDYRREVLPGIGHFIQREDPQVVLQAILERAEHWRGR